MNFIFDSILIRCMEGTVVFSLLENNQKNQNEDVSVCVGLVKKSYAIRFDWKPRSFFFAVPKMTVIMMISTLFFLHNFSVRMCACVVRFLHRLFLSPFRPHST